MWARWIIKRRAIKSGCVVRPERQSVKARLHNRMLLGLCKEGVLTTATMATRLLRKAKAQIGILTAATATSFIKAAVSLAGITSSSSKPQMPLFQSEAILILTLDGMRQGLIATFWPLNLIRRE